MTARTAVTVPADDTQEFLTQHLPRLLRHVAVEAPGIDLPAPERPTLVVTVRFSPAHRLDFALAWRYGDRAPVPYQAPLSDDRDADAEDIIRQRVEAAWQDAGTVPFAAAGTAVRDRRRRVRAHDCSPRSRRSPTSPSRSTASALATANSPGIRT